MKRCISCNALIRDDDVLCPYCYMESKYDIEEKLESAEIWKTRVSANVVIPDVSVSAFIGTADIRCLTPNEIREKYGLEKIKGE